MFKNRFIAGVCALLMLTGCSGEAGDSLASLLGPAPKWVDSDVGELVPKDKEIRLQDDFAAAANLDYIRTGDPVGEGLVGTMSRLYSNLDELLKSDLSGTKAGDELSKYYDLLNDRELRREQGFAPLKEYTDDISSIKTTDDLYSFICDPVRNPLGISMVIPSELQRSSSDPSKHNVMLIAPRITFDADMYIYMSSASYEAKVLSDEFIKYMLSHMGYDSSTIKDIILNSYETEKFLVTHSEMADSEDYDEFSESRDKIAAMAKGYPILEYLDSIGYQELDSFVPCGELLRSASGYCRSHPDKVRDFILCRYLYDLYICLDEDTIAEIDEVTKELTFVETEPDLFDEETMRKINSIKKYVIGTSLGPACAQLYCERYVTDEARTRLTNMTTTFIDDFEKILSEEEWLSEEGKQAAIDKLSAMEIHILDMDWELIDYNGLNITSKAEGGSFLKAYTEAKRFENRITGEMLSEKFDRSVWDPRYLEINTLETNSFYSPEHNAIFILAGIATDPLYHDGMSAEELLGGIGWVVGHEITHGFDKNGVTYDKNGIHETWLPDKDQSRFAEMATKVGSYFSTMHPYDNCGMYNGNGVAAEAIADMGGVRLGLASAEHIEGFDYDLYFRTCARVWQTNRSLADEKMYFSGDSHPLNYLRINCTLTQYDEFYETYGVQESDNMYTAPENRVKIW